MLVGCMLFMIFVPLKNNSHGERRCKKLQMYDLCMTYTGGLRPLGREGVFIAPRLLKHETLVSESESINYLIYVSDDIYPLSIIIIIIFLYREGTYHHFIHLYIKRNSEACG